MPVEPKYQEECSFHIQTTDEQLKADAAFIEANKEWYEEALAVMGAIRNELLHTDTKLDSDSFCP